MDGIGCLAEYASSWSVVLIDFYRLGLPGRELVFRKIFVMGSMQAGEDTLAIEESNRGCCIAETYLRLYCTCFMPSMENLISHGGLFMLKKRKWPADCVWPEPIWGGEGDLWDLDLAELQELDEDGEELKEIKGYMDELVTEGRLNEDYSLNEDYEDWDNEEDNEEAGGDSGLTEWTPEIGIDYWDEGFDMEGWQWDLSNHINLLKIDVCDPEEDPVNAVREAIGYSFINENLLRQAFTRRSFAREYNLAGCSEELEFYGDMIFHTIVTRELSKRFSDLNTCEVDAPFQSRYQEGSLSKIREKYVSGSYLSARAVLLGLDRFILYGKGEETSESAREDMMEALIGAVAVDCGWDWSVLEDVADRLLCLQLDHADDLLSASYYEQLNTWHQKHFGRMPEYVLYRKRKDRGHEFYSGSVKFHAPENDKGISPYQHMDVKYAATRSDAREEMARDAVLFLRGHGLWIRLEDAGIEPHLEDAINQLQELYQKKYLDQPPVYSFEECGSDEWYCTCTCDGMDGFGRAVGKKKAKKKAAYMVLVHLMMAAGICRDEWRSTMWNMNI